MLASFDRKGSARTMAHAKSSRKGPTPDQRVDEDVPRTNRSDLGEKLRGIRRKKGWTLDQASAATGVARSTLSKIENGAMSPTFDLIQKLAQGLGIDLVQLFGGGAVSGATGRRSLMLDSPGPVLDNETYTHEFLAAELSRKRLLPFVSTVKARNISEFKEFNKHQGDVFLYVLSGVIDFHSEYYSVSRLREGQSIYFDGRMAHAIVSASEANARILWVCDNLSGENGLENDYSFPA